MAASLRATEHSPSERFPSKLVYDPNDVNELDYRTVIGDPGTFPFTRGPRVPKKTNRGWIQRELSGEGRPDRSNAQFRELIRHGQQGLDVIGDAPTAAYLDPDHPYARFAVGTQGVSLCRLQDYMVLYDGIPLDEMTLSHSLQPLFCVAALFSVAKHRGIDPAKIRGSVVNAPYYGEDSGYAVKLPFELRVRMAVDSIEFATQHMPKFHSFLEDTYFFSDGGLDAVSEIGLGLVEIRGITRRLVDRGLAVDQFAPRIAMLVNCGMEVFTEIAKVRAARRVYATMMRDDFGAVDPRSMALNIAVHTSGMSLTAQQPINNVVRGTIQVMAMAMAGVQGIEVSTFDEAFRTPTPAGHMVGLRTQQIVHHEAAMSDVTDPLGGSYYLERLTDDLVAQITNFVRRIEGLGDPADLSADGVFRQLFAEGMAEQAKAVADGSKLRVGVNCFLESDHLDLLDVHAASIEIKPDLEWIDEISRWKRNRDNDATSRSLQRVKRVCDLRDANLVPAVIDAFEAGATMGEIVGQLRESYGLPADPLRGPSN